MIERNSNKHAAFAVVGVTEKGKYKFLSGYDDEAIAQTAAQEWQSEEDARAATGALALSVQVMPCDKLFELRPELKPEEPTPAEG